MDQTLLISNLILWVVILGLSGVVVMLARQIGVLHERITPVGALMVAQGVKIGEASPRFELENLNGSRLVIGEPRSDGHSTLIFFVSPTCPVCSSILPVLRRTVEQTPKLDLVVASDGDRETHEKFVARKGLTDLPYVLSGELGMTFGIGKLPYGVMIDAQGILRAHGLVNSREHIESLIEAEREGVASIQDYMAREAK